MSLSNQDEQQLVIDANRFIDDGPDSVADLHVFRRKPAADAAVLQVCMEAFRKISFRKFKKSGLTFSEIFSHHLLYSPN